jgi:hypothetical protein
MVLPFISNSNNNTNDDNHVEPPRILTEEEQVFLAIDQGVHEVNGFGKNG